LFYDPKNQKDFEDVEMICGTISENEMDELLTISDTEDAARNPRNLQLLHNGIHRGSRIASESHTSGRRTSRV
jgi:hypothetical protein